MDTYGTLERQTRCRSPAKLQLSLICCKRLARLENTNYCLQSQLNNKTNNELPVAQKTDGSLTSLLSFYLKQLILLTSFE